MTADDVRRLLNNPVDIPEASFAILQTLATLANEGQETECRDLVLRALEHKESFGTSTRILDALVREVGLFPYVDPEELDLVDSIAYEFHRPEHTDDVVFHREQAEVYRRLAAGDSVILSAPTSFGKSKVIDAIVASGAHDNIVVIVPTIALIDETRRRLSVFSDQYKLVTQVAQRPGKRNLFLFTAERLNAYEDLPRITFFVIDEFYKIGAMEEDPRRTVALNQAFYKLSKFGAQFYLLGPSVRQIPAGFEERFRCQFFPTRFATVASDQIRVNSREPMTALMGLLEKLRGEPTLIFCKSPKRANDVARRILESNIDTGAHAADASTWMFRNFHDEWILPLGLQRGIGIHHGKLPRSLAQYVVRAFNQGQINFLVCTSTLIEGVNTKAKNVVIFDNTIAKRELDFFTFNNIRGRSGRMFQHFVGRVYLFHDPPQEDLPLVDFPVFTQGDDSPASLLIQMDDADLKAHSRERLEPFLNETDLPIELLKKHPSVEPDALVDLARRLRKLHPAESELLQWSGIPKWAPLKFSCELVWKHLVGRRQVSGVFSGAQLAQRTLTLSITPDIHKRILQELEAGPFAAKSGDEAVERVFEFDRSWANFELPRLFRALSDVRQHVLGGPGNYLFYAARVEHLFRKPFQIALEEYGLPLQVTDKFANLLDDQTPLDDALQRIKQFDAAKLDLDPFERQLFDDCQSVL